MNLRPWIIRGLLLAFGVLFVRAAWVTGGGVIMLSVGAVLLGGGLIYNLPRRKTDASPFGLGIMFILGAYLAETPEIKAVVQIFSVVLAAAIVLAVLSRVRRRRTEIRQHQRFRELAQRPANWA